MPALRLRLATCCVLPEPDPDARPLLQALGRAGIEAREAAWDDPAEDWDAPVPTLIRSTWNYHHRPAEFLAWAERAARAAPLRNEVATVRWNAHKRYLDDLAARGVPVIPTAHVARGAPARLAEIAGARGWDDVVVKPAVSAGSWGTRRLAARDFEGPGEAHLRAILAERDAMIQPYFPSVETWGERCLVWIDGEITHSIRKRARFAGNDESTTPAAIEPDERDLADRAIAAAPARPLYARIDTARDRDGRPHVMELELIEPSLFFDAGPRALERLVPAVRRLADR